MCLCFATTEAVRRNHLTAKATTAQIEHEVKDWLKFATERDGGRRQRDQRPRDATATPQDVATDDLSQ